MNRKMMMKLHIIGQTCPFKSRYSCKKQDGRVGIRIGFEDQKQFTCFGSTFSPVSTASGTGVQLIGKWHQGRDRMGGVSTHFHMHSSFIFKNEIVPHPLRCKFKDTGLL